LLASFCAAFGGGRRKSEGITCPQAGFHPRTPTGGLVALMYLPKLRIYVCNAHVVVLRILALAFIVRNAERL